MSEFSNISLSVTASVEDVKRALRVDYDQRVALRESGECHVLVERYLSDDETTLSNIYVNGRFICYGLEDAYHEKKIKGRTRISQGVYRLKLRTFGGFHARHAKSPYYRDTHIGMIEIADVPEFTNILIHAGNTHRDTSGCLLVGMQAMAHLSPIAVHQSRLAYQGLYPMLAPAVRDGLATIEFRDCDR